MTSRDEDVARIAEVLHASQRWCDGTENIDWRTSDQYEDARLFHGEDAAVLYAAGLRVASTTGLDAAARTFLTHVAEAAEWPTPGIGCDAKCETADALRAALATPPAVAEDVTT